MFIREYDSSKAVSIYLPKTRIYWLSLQSCCHLSLWNKNSFSEWAGREPMYIFVLFGSTKTAPIIVVIYSGTLSSITIRNLTNQISCKQFYFFVSSESLYFFFKWNFFPTTFAVKAFSDMLYSPFSKGILQTVEADCPTTSTTEGCATDTFRIGTLLWAIMSNSLNSLLSLASPPHCLINL